MGAQNILDARTLYPDKSLADMYGDKMYLFPELLQAHNENDKIIKKTYGFAENMCEEDIVAALMKKYQELAGQTPRP